MIRRPPRSTPFPTRRSSDLTVNFVNQPPTLDPISDLTINEDASLQTVNLTGISSGPRSEEHTSELQSRLHLVCRLLLEKKKKNTHQSTIHHTYPHSS